MNKDKDTRQEIWTKWFDSNLIDVSHFVLLLEVIIDQEGRPAIAKWTGHANYSCQTQVSE